MLKMDPNNNMSKEITMFIILTIKICRILDLVFQKYIVMTAPVLQCLDQISGGEEPFFKIYVFIKNHIFLQYYIFFKKSIV